MEKMTAKRKKRITKAEFAASESVSRQMVGKWVRLGMPCEVDGQIDAAAARKWLQRHTLRNVATSAGQSLAEHKSRKEAALASLRELELKKLQGDMIDAGEAQAAWSSMILTARNRLLALPSKLAPHVAAETDVGTCQHILDREVREALSALAEELGRGKGSE